MNRLRFPLLLLLVLATVGSECQKKNDFFSVTGINGNGNGNGEPLTGSIGGTAFVDGSGFSGADVGISGPVSRTTMTSASGTYLFGDVPIGAYVVTLDGLPSDVTCPDFSQSVNVVSNQTATADFNCMTEAPMVGSIGGKVTVDGSNFAGATVSISGQTTMTASDGSYQFTGLAPGSYTVSVSGLPMNVTCSPMDQTVTVVADQTANADFDCITQPSFTVNITNLKYEHMTGFSIVCWLVTTNPIQPGAPYSATLTGSMGFTNSWTGSLDSSGSTQINATISQFDSYIASGFVGTNGGQIDAMPQTINVTSQQGAGCP